MFYTNEKGRRIHLLNTKPRNLSAGGIITGHPPLKDKYEDTVNSLLQYNSLVVPLPVMRSGIMDGYKGKLMGKECHDPTDLGRTIVMPGELVVHKDHAAEVERYLAKHGIHLPLPKNFDVSKILHVKK